MCGLQSNLHALVGAARLSCPCRPSDVLLLGAADVLQWMQKCVDALRPGGLLIVKENICSSGFVVDEEDSSLTRSDAYLQARVWQATPH